MKTDDKANIIIGVEELLGNESILKTLTKYAIFDELLLEGIVKWLVDDQIVWDSDDYKHSWWTASSGQSRMSRVRELLTPLVPEILQNEVKRTRESCERLEKMNQEYYSRIHSLSNLVSNAYDLGYSDKMRKKEPMWPRSCDDIAGRIEKISKNPDGQDAE